MTKRVGIIAEDMSDVDVIATLVRKIARKTFRKEHFVGDGCGKIVVKCQDWAENLRDRGCSLLIVAHDLDTKVENKLRSDLNRALNPSPIRLYVLIIPVREIEAWLLADHEAIRAALNLKCTVKKVPNPEAINRPKEHLRDLVYLRSNKKTRYLNTVHNVKIAEECAVANLRRCASFRPMEEFVLANL